MSKKTTSNVGSINFSDGFKEFRINNDPDRVIRFNPCDVDIIQRFDKAVKELREERDKLEDVRIKADGSPAEEGSEIEKAAETLARFNQVIRAKLAYIFKSDVFDAVFNGQSPVALVGGGKMLFEAFMDAAFDVIEQEVAKETEARVQQYTGKYKEGKAYLRPMGS